MDDRTETAEKARELAFNRRMVAGFGVGTVALTVAALAVVARNGWAMGLMAAMGLFALLKAYRMAARLEAVEDDLFGGADYPPKESAIVVRLYELECDVWGGRNDQGLCLADRVTDLERLLGELPDDPVGGVAARLAKLEARTGAQKIDEVLRELAAACKRPELSHLHPIEVVLNDYAAIKASFERLRSAARDTDRNIANAEGRLGNRCAALSREVYTLRSQVNAIVSANLDQPPRPGIIFPDPTGAAREMAEALKARQAANGTARPGLDLSVLGEKPVTPPPSEETKPCPPAP